MCCCICVLVMMSFFFSIRIRHTRCALVTGFRRVLFRSRLRSRLLDDAEGLADYELIEYLLALAIPRRDTKPLAKALLREFGSLAQLVNADPESLRRVDGDRKSVV